MSKIISAIPCNACVLDMPIMSLISRDSSQKIETDKDIKKFLKDKNNIVVSLGQKIVFAKRDEIKEDMSLNENIYNDKDGNSYFRLLGRHLVSRKDIKDVINDKYSIFNVETLKDVIEVKNKATKKNEKRSVYEVISYSSDEY
jgi:hypothetical protein